MNTHVLAQIRLITTHSTQDCGPTALEAQNMDVVSYSSLHGCCLIQ